MLVTFKYVGTTNSQYNNNQEYVAIALGSNGALFLQTGSVLGGESISTLNNTALWQLISVSIVGAVQIYP